LVFFGWAFGATATFGAGLGAGFALITFFLTVISGDNSHRRRRGLNDRQRDIIKG
jgi:hypothetical protein